MRKIVLTFAAILAAATCSYAQKNFDWGVKAAVNFTSEYDTGDFSDGDVFVGFTAGFIADFKINDLLSIQPELLYSMQGSENYLSKGNKQSGYKSFIYQYLNLPVMFKFFVYQDKLSVDIGPQVGYLLKATNKTVPKNKAKQKHDMKKDPDVIENEFDVAGALGLSYKFAESFDVFARYTMGFVKTQKDQYTVAADKTIPVNNKNYGVQIGVSARF